MTEDIRRGIADLLPRLRRFAFALTGTIEDADDVVQIACERALVRLEQFTPGTRLDSWMFRIVQTVSIDLHRKARRSNTVWDPDAMQSVPHDARIHELAEARMDLAIVRRAIALLPDEQRSVLALVTIDGMSYQEAADTLDVPIGTVMSRLARARKKLAEALNYESGGSAHHEARR